ncbi:FkbM family methyltransferase [Edaphobacter albus]|uniref:FkbM family methyltransferase n=1 Tax=Edaphobacter sp. 4G125 TaxID=2763071 RepID=UPI001648BB8E|nr:FkbM family methyltransferase [Edaphobacter sp. 4G125]QNI35404.1 FkbM family methyltransferase [Edaphobacter sp. 4G125]
MKQLLGTLQYIIQHPLNNSDRRGSLLRYAKWQVGSRLVPGPVIVPFVNDTVFIASPGMTGVTQNIYTGLSDFFDCAFLLHLLRADDLFVDVGANAGIYTVLAAGAIGSTVISVEPIPQTFEKLCANIRINSVSDKVAAHNIGLGSKEAILRFTSSRDTMNKVIDDVHYDGPSINVRVSSLDMVLQNKVPQLIKIDVEGWESEVIAGSTLTLKNPSLLGLIVEMNGSETGLNENERSVHECLSANGFSPCTYNPVTRSLTPIPSKNKGGNNTLYVRDVSQIEARLKSAPHFRVVNKSF